MRRSIRLGLWLLAIALITAPIGFMLTILLVPVWRWVEDNLGIEAIGHSGPAGWCYYLVYSILLGAAAGLSARMAAR